MQYHLEKFEELGADVVALCPQLPEFNESIVSDLNLGFPVWRDADNMVSTAFGLTLPQPADVIAAEKTLGLDLPAHNGSENWDLPMPARFVIDTSSQILYNALHVDHRLRTDPVECLNCMVSG